MPAQEVLKSAQQSFISLSLIMAKERHPNIITSATTLIILSYLFSSIYIIIHFIYYWYNKDQEKPNLIFLWKGKNDIENQ